MSRKLPLKRYQHTLNFLQQVMPSPGTILDLGIKPVLGKCTRRYYAVYATKINT